MITMQGKGVSKGLAKGSLFFFRRPGTAVIKAAADTQTEKSRLAAAQAASVAQLETLADECRGEAEEAVILFETHAMLVEDEDFTACILTILEDEGCNAEYAVRQAGERFAAMFTAMDDPYMQARAADVRDVVRRIVDNLMGGVSGTIELEEPVILCADDLAPSETLRLDRAKLLGFVTREGSKHSHTAILARAMGIPAVCAVGEALREDYGGRLCCMDGENGRLIIDPEPAVLAAFEEQYDRQRERERLPETVSDQEDVTLDGQRLTLCCNIAVPEDVAEVLSVGGRGIGLFRSEFLYLSANDFPSEEEQFEAYRAVAAAMQGRRVVIRTLDIGADKQADYFRLKKEENPALGMRGIRVCLDRPEVFRTQLRALYRASAYGKLAILFPMIVSVWEVKACREACRKVMAELDAEGVPYNKDTELGVMIETPASVLVADALAKEVDFFSVGTNDLTQYILACDRQAGGLGRFYDPHHPAVLRAVKMAADAAHAAGIWIGICGELAADAQLLPTFLAMGIDELSVPPAAVPPLRAALRRSAAGSCTLEKLEC